MLSVGRTGGKSSVQFSSVTQSCPTLCETMDYSTPGFPVHHQLPELTQIMSIESVMPSNHLVLCHPLLLVPSIFPSIRVFSNELTIHINWPKYRRFRFSTSPSNEYSGLISLRHVINTKLIKIFKLNWLILLFKIFVNITILRNCCCLDAKSRLTLLLPHRL